MPTTLTTSDVGEAAKEFLAEHGLEAVVPHIHSSDDEDCMVDPFRFYLKRRLGLVPARGESKAYEIGRWLHHHFEHLTEDAREAERACVSEVATETSRAKDTGLGLGWSEERTRERQDAIKETARLTGAWLKAACDVTTRYGTIAEFLSASHWETVSVEEEFTCPQPGHPELIASLKPDRLLRHKKTGALWPVDLKSCSEPTSVRASTCPWEFQTWHYPMCLAAMMQDGTAPFSGKTIGGVIHILLQKPTIVFGDTDRPFRLVARSKRSGKQGRAYQHGDGWRVVVEDDTGHEEWSDCHGELGAQDILEKRVGVKAKKEYEGEPSFDRYVERCKQWYTASGPYKHLTIERDGSPVVEISFTDGALLLDPNTVEEYYSKASRIAHFASCAPYPSEFPRNFRRLREWRRLSPYAPFYLSPVKDWPEIVQREGFIIDHRD